MSAHCFKLRAGMEPYVDDFWALRLNQSIN